MINPNWCWLMLLIKCLGELPSEWMSSQGSVRLLSLCVAVRGVAWDAESQLSVLQCISGLGVVYSDQIYHPAAVGIRLSARLLSTTQSLLEWRPVSVCLFAFCSFFQLGNTWQVRCKGATINPLDLPHAAPLFAAVPTVTLWKSLLIATNADAKAASKANWGTQQVDTFGVLCI